MHSVPQTRVSVPNEQAHVEAEGEEASSQQVPQSSQVGDREVVGVHPSAPHPVDHPVGQVEEDNHLVDRGRCFYSIHKGLTFERIVEKNVTGFAVPILFVLL